VDNAKLVRRYQGVRHLTAVLQGVVHPQGPAGDSLVQSLAIHVFHHQKMRSAFVAHVVQGADMRMVQPGYGLRFPPEAGQPIRITGKMFRQEEPSEFPS
jgi:hypothetical protein